jgi:hypothetical protein
MTSIPLRKLTLSLVRQTPIWHSTPSKDGDLWVKPELRSQLSSLKNCLIATDTTMADGSCITALIENIHVENLNLTKHYLQAHFRIDGRWWCMARYHDLDYDQKGASGLAMRLGKSIEQVFPLTYDIQEFCTVESEALCGAISANPINRLTRKEIMRMFVPK